MIRSKKTTTVLTGLIAVGMLLSPTLQANAFSANWQQGASIQSRYDGDFGSAEFRASMDRLAESGVNHISLVVPHFQSGNSSVDIYAGVNTPSDESLISGIRYVKSLGIEVSIKLFMESGEGWRANIRPYDKGQWFANYTNIAVKYAQIAEAEGVAMMVLGTEMVGVASANQDPANTGYWRDLIAQVRANYSGALTYGGNWGGAYNEKDEIEFWDDLDYIGVSAYYEPGRYVDGNNVEALKGYWNEIDQNELIPLSQRFNKPIIFTEVGYRNISGTTVDPWNFSRGGEPNEGEQRAAYQALFEAFEDAGHLAGIHLWDWSSDPSACGSNNFDYTYCGKLAEEVVRQYYQGANGQVTPAPELPVDDSTVSDEVESEDVEGNSDTEEEIEDSEESGDQEGTETEENDESQEGEVTETTTETNEEGSSTVEVDQEFNADNLAFGIKIGSSVETLVAGQSTGFTATVMNNSGFDVNNFNANFEIYDENGNQVYQTYDEGLSLAEGDSVEYELDFVPQNPGNYVLKMGAFSSDWSELYLWIDDLLPFTVYDINEVDDSGEPLSEVERNSSERILRIWWPSNGEAVDGVQPFKGVVDGLGLDEYSMYWQVDGDVINEMGNAEEDGIPHKLALVDLSSWNWNESGNYILTFTAVDNNDEIIEQSNVEISVVN